MSQDSFIRYLHAKKSVDDRALNLRVWNQLRGSILGMDSPQHPLRVLEIGGGIGTMLARLLEDGLLPDCDYCLLDINEANTQSAPIYLSEWANIAGFEFQQHPHNDYQITMPSGKINLKIVCADVFDFISKSRSSWDLLIGHAVLDLFDLSTAIRRLKAAINPKGLMYFTINYDGHTIFEPQIEPLFEKELLTLYNQSMDERLTDGKPSGDSQTGRHLFEQLRLAGVELLAAGSSDWVVFSGFDGYPHQEADFLGHLIDMIYNEMKTHPGIDQEQLNRWTAERKNQIANHDLVCIVHQLDFLGRV